MQDDVREAGQWLIEYRNRWENREAEWFLRLVEFDRSERWAADGQRSCAAWMTWKLRMARSTAFEKLQVGYALDSRPVLLRAFGDGRLSYSALRLIASLEDTNEDVDESLVQVATTEGASIIDLQHMVRLYRLYRDQELPPPEPELKRQVSVRRAVGEGLSRITITLADLEVDEFLLALKSFDDPLFRAAAVAKPGDESAAADDFSSGGPTDQARENDDRYDDDDVDGDRQPGDESAAADSKSWRDSGTRKARRADAFMNLVAAALSGDGRRAAGDDRYLLNVVKIVNGIGATLVDGEPVTDSDLTTIACDCSRVTHYVTDKGEPLHLGRKTRDWSTAQRRAINVRDGAHCRFPGCDSPFVDIHHIHWWDNQGPTDVDNAMNCCRHHHTLIHNKGFLVDGDPNDQLRFTRSDGTPIGATYPALAARLRLQFAG